MPAPTIPGSGQHEGVKSADWSRWNAEPEPSESNPMQGKPNGLEDWPVKQRNLACYLFLHPAARDLFTDSYRQITACVADLRAIAGTAPDLTNLVGELSSRAP